MSEAAPSPEYTRFLNSVAGADPAHREELDTAALLVLGKQERKAAEELLIERIKETDDWRAPPALALLRTKRAVRPMKARLGEAKGRMKLALARALVDLGALDRLDALAHVVLAAGMVLVARLTGAGRTALPMHEAKLPLAAQASKAAPPP